MPTDTQRAIGAPAILDEHKIVLLPVVRPMFCKIRGAALTIALLGALALSACDHTQFFANVNVGPPPPPVFGPVGMAPGAGWMWTDGYYVWGGNAWVWRPGRWARPPHPGYVWRKPSYERHRNGYRVHKGGWVRR